MHLVLVPTYNERANIHALLEAILSHAEVHVLVIDDASPDGTGSCVRNHEQFGQRVFLLAREGKQGLGAAYRAGFSWGLSRPYETLLQMDADFSHDPKDIARLIEEYRKQSADVVIGSRKVAGGSIEGWNAWRMFCSTGAMVASRMILGLQARDVTAGFRLWRADFLRTLEVDALRSNGYAFQEELLLRAQERGGVCCEIPVIFRDRKEGVSKLGGKDIREFFLTLLRLVPRKRVLGAVLFLALFAFQYWQLTSFNPYWGYDGGAHVDILETLLREGRFPSLSENYLAWHEPGYYLLLAGLGWIGVPFFISHALIVLGIDVVIFRIARKLGMGTLSSVVALLSVVLLPPFLEVSMFYTNEALNYLFLLLIFASGIDLWRGAWSWRHAWLLVLWTMLGGVTKITALVAYGVVSIALLLKGYQEKSKHYVLLVFLGFFLAFLAYLPWLMIRSQHLSEFSINNYDMLPARTLVLDERVRFMTAFDFDIFTFPFWYSGGRGFWSMIYADAVSDYYGLFEHQDVKLKLADEDRVMTTHSGTYVSAYRVPFARAAIYLGIIPIGGVLLGGFLSARETLWWFLRRKSDYSMGVVVFGGAFAFLLALMYYAYRYPYYDQGVVKSIFIGPGIALALLYGHAEIFKRSFFAWCVYVALWVCYGFVIVNLFFIP